MSPTSACYVVIPPPGALNRGKYDAIYQLTPAFVEELRTFYGARPSS